MVHITETLGTQEYLKAKLNTELNSHGISVVGTLTITPHTQVDTLQLARPLPVVQRTASFRQRWTQRLCSTGPCVSSFSGVGRAYSE